MRVGRTLREAREQAGLSLRELARQMGVSATFLSDVELERCALSDARVQQLPDAIRSAVVEAMIADLRRREADLWPLLSSNRTD